MAKYAKFFSLGSTLNTGVLQIQNGLPIDATLRNVADQNNTVSPLKLSTTSVTAYGGGNIATNTAYGTSALLSNVLGTYNTAIGYEALNASIGEWHTAIGYRALKNTLNSVNHTAIGFEALLLDQSIGDNTAIGSRAARANTSGNQLVAIGSGTLQGNTTGRDNTAVGYNAGNNLGAGSYNTLIGSAAGQLITGSSNSALGYLALQRNPANFAVAIGQEAAYFAASASTGTIAIGYRSQYTGQGGAGNITIGYESGFQLQSSENTFLGYRAGRVENSSAGRNTYIGYEAGRHISNGDSNIAVGYQAQGNSSAAVQSAYNVSVGRKTLFSNEGWNNTAIGSESMYSNLTGEYNTAIGSDSLYTNSSGGNNVTGGAFSMYSNTVGIANTAFGYGALGANSSGSNNVSIGNLSLLNNLSGNNNTAVGDNADSADFSGSVILGKDATATGNNQFVVGSTGTNAGAVVSQVNTSTKYWSVVINGVAQKILLA